MKYCVSAVRPAARIKLSLSIGTALLGLAASASVACAEPIDFNYTGSLVDFTVPTTATYQILAFGAQGGTETFGNGMGGLGAEIGADFLLTAGESLEIAVGGTGANGSFAAAGGGGSFVVGPGNTPLVIAGGGGGAGFTGAVDGLPGGGGLTGPDGGPGAAVNGVGNGGTGGNGGGSGDLTRPTGGGGGGGDLTRPTGGGGGGGGFLSAGGSAFGGGTGGGDFPGLGGGDFGGGFGGGGGASVGAGGGGGYSGGGGALAVPELKLPAAVAARSMPASTKS